MPGVASTVATGSHPDVCVSSPEPSRLLARLVSSRAIFDFSQRYGNRESSSVGEIAGAGSRPDVSNEHVTLIDPDFSVDDAVLDEFQAFLGDRGFRLEEEDFAASREEISRFVEEEILRQAFSQGHARRRGLAWDPQVQKALDLMPRAEALLRDPGAYVAQWPTEATVGGTH